MLLTGLCVILMRRSVAEVKDAAASIRRHRAGKVMLGPWSGPGPKKLQLPRSGLRVDPVPINLPKGFTDRFKVNVHGEDLVVFRVDEGKEGHGWAHPYELRWFDQTEFHGEVVVGKFDGEGWKEVSLPASNLYVDPTPVNEQCDQWTDTFECEVVGTRLAVRRTDVLNGGWGQNLVLRYCLITAEARAILDTDGDGFVSAAEFAAADRDGDGRLSSDEIECINRKAAMATVKEDNAARTIQRNLKAFVFRKKLPF